MEEQVITCFSALKKIADLQSIPPSSLVEKLTVFCNQKLGSTDAKGKKLSRSEEDKTKACLRFLQAVGLEEGRHDDAGLDMTVFLSTVAHCLSLQIVLQEEGREDEVCGDPKKPRLLVSFASGTNARGKASSKQQPADVDEMSCCPGLVQISEQEFDDARLIGAISPDVLEIAERSESGGCLLRREKHKKGNLDVRVACRFKNTHFGHIVMWDGTSHDSDLQLEVWCSTADSILKMAKPQDQYVLCGTLALVGKRPKLVIECNQAQRIWRVARVPVLMGETKLLCGTRPSLTFDERIPFAEEEGVLLFDWENPRQSCRPHRVDGLLQGANEACPEGPLARSEPAPYLQRAITSIANARSGGVVLIGASSQGSLLGVTDNTSKVRETIEKALSAIDPPLPTERCQVSYLEQDMRDGRKRVAACVAVHKSVDEVWPPHFASEYDRGRVRENEARSYIHHTVWSQRFSFSLNKYKDFLDEMRPICSGELEDEEQQNETGASSAAAMKGSRLRKTAVMTKRDIWIFGFERSILLQRCKVAQCSATRATLTIQTVDGGEEMLRFSSEESCRTFQAALAVHVEDSSLLTLDAVQVTVRTSAACLGLRNVKDRLGDSLAIVEGGADEFKAIGTSDPLVDPFTQWVSVERAIRQHCHDYLALMASVGYGAKLRLGIENRGTCVGVYCGAFSVEKGTGSGGAGNLLVPAGGGADFLASCTRRLVYRTLLQWNPIIDRLVAPSVEVFPLEWNFVLSNAVARDGNVAVLTYKEGMARLFHEWRAKNKWIWDKYKEDLTDMRLVPVELTSQGKFVAIALPPSVDAIKISPEIVKGLAGSFHVKKVLPTTLHVPMYVVEISLQPQDSHAPIMYFGSSVRCPLYSNCLQWMPFGDLVARCEQARLRDWFMEYASSTSLLSSQQVYRVCVLSSTHIDLSALARVPWDLYVNLSCEKETSLALVRTRHNVAEVKDHRPVDGDGLWLEAFGSCADKKLPPNDWWKKSFAQPALWSFVGGRKDRPFVVTVLHDGDTVAGTHLEHAQIIVERLREFSAGTMMAVLVCGGCAPSSFKPGCFARVFSGTWQYFCTSLRSLSFSESGTSSLQSRMDHAHELLTKAGMVELDLRSPAFSQPRHLWAGSGLCWNAVHKGDYCKPYLKGYVEQLSKAIDDKLKSSDGERVTLLRIEHEASVGGTSVVRRCLESFASRLIDRIPVLMFTSTAPDLGSAANAIALFCREGTDVLVLLDRGVSSNDMQFKETLRKALVGPVNSRVILVSVHWNGEVGRSDLCIKSGGADEGAALLSWVKAHVELNGSQYERENVKALTRLREEGRVPNLSLRFVCFRCLVMPERAEEAVSRLALSTRSETLQFLQQAAFCKWYLQQHLPLWRLVEDYSEVTFRKMIGKLWEPFLYIDGYMVEFQQSFVAEIVLSRGANLRECALSCLRIARDTSIEVLQSCVTQLLLTEKAEEGEKKTRGSFSKFVERLLKEVGNDECLHFLDEVLSLCEESGEEKAMWKAKEDERKRKMEEDRKRKMTSRFFESYPSPLAKIRSHLKAHKARVLGFHFGRLQEAVEVAEEALELANTPVALHIWCQLRFRVLCHAISEFETRSGLKTGAPTRKSREELMGMLGVHDGLPLIISRLDECKALTWFGGAFYLSAKVRLYLLDLFWRYKLFEVCVGYQNLAMQAGSALVCASEDLTAPSVQIDIGKLRQTLQRLSMQKGLQDAVDKLLHKVERSGSQLPAVHQLQAMLIYRGRGSAWTHVERQKQGDMCRMLEHDIRHAPEDAPLDFAFCSVMELKRLLLAPEEANEQMCDLALFCRERRVCVHWARYYSMACLYVKALNSTNPGDQHQNWLQCWKVFEESKALVHDDDEDFRATEFLRLSNGKYSLVHINRLFSRNKFYELRQAGHATAGMGLRPFILFGCSAILGKESRFTGTTRPLENKRHRQVLVDVDIHRWQQGGMSWHVVLKRGHLRYDKMGTEVDLSDSRNVSFFIAMGRVGPIAWGPCLLTATMEDVHQVYGSCSVPAHLDEPEAVATIYATKPKHQLPPWKVPCKYEARHGHCSRAGCKFLHTKSSK